MGLVEKFGVWLKDSAWSLLACSVGRGAQSMKGFDNAFGNSVAEGAWHIQDYSVHVCCSEMLGGFADTQ